MEDNHVFCGKCKETFPSITDYENHSCPDSSDKCIKPTTTNTSSTLKCGLCDYTTTNMSKLLYHTSSTHASLEDPLKCSYCSETFSSYRDIQKHRCGAPDGSKDSNEPMQVVDLSTLSQRKSQFTNTVYATTEFSKDTNKASKNEESQNDQSSSTELGSQANNSEVVDMTISSRQKTQVEMISASNEPSETMDKTSDEDTLEEDIIRTLSPSIPDSPVGTRMTLRRRQSLRYTEIVKSNQFEEEPENEDIPHNPKIQKKPVAKSGNEKLSKDQPILYRCKYCSFSSKYPGNHKTHVQKHLTPGRNHFECKNCGLKFLIRKSLREHQCTKSKSGSNNPKRNAQPLTKFKPGQDELDNENLTFRCRLCEFTCTPKINAIKHIHRHRCKSCREFFQTVVKCNKHMASCSKPPSRTRDRIQSTKTTYGKTVYFRRAVPSTLVDLMCKICNVTGFKSLSYFNAHTCSIGKKGKVSDAISASTPHPKGATGRMEGYDAQLMMYCCKYCLFTSPSALALINHNKKLNHSPTNMPLVKTPEVQARRFEFAREIETRRKKPRMKGWDEEAMLYTCDLCKFTTPTPIALYNHKKFHNVDGNSENSDDTVDGLDDELDESGGHTDQHKDAHYKYNDYDFTTDKLRDFNAREGLHTEKRLLKCFECNVGFSDQFSLNIHQRKMHAQVMKVIETESHSAPVLTEMGNNVEFHCPKSGCDFITSDSLEIDHHLNIQHMTIRRRSQISETESIEIPFRKEINTVSLKHCPHPDCSFIGKDPDVLNRHMNLHFSSSTKENQPGASVLPRSVVTDANEVMMDSTEIMENNPASIHTGTANRLIHTHSQSMLNARHSTGEGRIQHAIQMLGESLEQSNTIPVTIRRENNASHLQGERSSVKRKLSNLEAEESSEKSQRVLSESENVEALAVNLKKNAVDKKEARHERMDSNITEQGEIDGSTEDELDPDMQPEDLSPGCSSTKPNPIYLSSQSKGEETQEHMQLECIRNHYMSVDDHSADTSDVSPSTSMPSLSPKELRGGGTVDSRSQDTWRRPDWSHTWRGKQLCPQVQMLSLHTLTTTTTSTTGQPPPPAAEGRVDKGSSSMLSHAPVENSMAVPVNLTSAPAMPTPNTSLVDRSAQHNLNEVPKSYLHRYPVPVPTEHRCGFCRIYFEDFRLFLHHLSRHYHENPWVCTHCWIDFKNVFAFLDHH